MKKLLLVLFLLIGGLTYSHALIINEIMSNPIGDDGGREWIEVYNNSSSTVDISGVTISIKGGSFVSVTAVSGGTTLSPEGYAIISSTVTGATKFPQDYPAYSGPLFRSSVSLVNTGVTSIEIKLHGVSADILSSYTAAKEGFTFSRIGGSFSLGSPTPGVENQVATEDTQVQATSTSNTTNTQAGIAQASPPLADIVLYMPIEKIVVAGAEATFSVFGLTRAGKQIENLTYMWAYGDGGQGVGSTTPYRFAYPGYYLVQVEGGNGYVYGTGRMSVRVVPPDIAITSIHTGKYGAYVDIENQNSYDLDFSQWKLVIDGVSFPFPKNTLIAGNSVTHLSGLAMGFASTTITSNTIVKILFPNQEEITRYSPPQETLLVLTSSNATSTPAVSTSSLPISVPLSISTIVRPKVNTLSAHSQQKPQARILGVTTSTVSKPSKNINTVKNGSTTQIESKSYNKTVKDTRIVAFFRSLFGKK